MDQKFIITKDPESAQSLRQLGLIEISSTNGHWMFMMDKTIMFNHIKNIAYTNTLTF